MRATIPLKRAQVAPHLVRKLVMETGTDSARLAMNIGHLVVAVELSETDLLTLRCVVDEALSVLAVQRLRAAVGDCTAADLIAQAEAAS